MRDVGFASWADSKHRGQSRRPESNHMLVLLNTIPRHSLSPYAPTRKGPQRLPWSLTAPRDERSCKAIPGTLKLAYVGSEG